MYRVEFEIGGYRRKISRRYHTPAAANKAACIYTEKYRAKNVVVYLERSVLELVNHEAFYIDRDLANNHVGLWLIQVDKSIDAKTQYVEGNGSDAVNTARKYAANDGVVAVKVFAEIEYDELIAAKK